MIDEFAHRFVYFYTGYIFAPHVFALAARVQHKPMHRAGRALRSGRVINGALVLAGYADRPFVSLALGLAGAGAVVAVAALMARSDVFQPLRYCGQNSIVIYLAFFLPMAATRIALLKTGIITDLGTISLLVTRPASSARWPGTGRCATRGSASCSSGRPGRGSGRRGRRPCSRRNSVAHHESSLASSGWIRNAPAVG